MESYNIGKKSDEGEGNAENKSKTLGLQIFINKSLYDKTQTNLKWMGSKKKKINSIYSSQILFWYDFFLSSSSSFSFLFLSALYILAFLSLPLNLLFVFELSTFSQYLFIIHCIIFSNAWFRLSVFCWSLTQRLLVQLYGISNSSCCIFQCQRFCPW